MPAVHRVLDLDPVTTLDDWASRDGGSGFEAALRLEPDHVIDLVTASGLRGRGGAGFPTGEKWRSARARSGARRPTMVINAAEGEPGSFKDRAILDANPYRVLEGALIAAHAIGAARIVVGLKESAPDRVRRVERAAAELDAAGWTASAAIAVVGGPNAYLLGEETALLEALAGRPPFPRIAPPYRHGADEVTASPGEAARTVLADEGDTTDAPTAVVNNVETVANLPGLLADGVDVFRSVGTSESPGTVVVTISGDTARHGVAELAMGTPLSEAIETIGDGPQEGRRLVAAMSGVANPAIGADQFDVPLSHEGFDALGSGLGAAGFLVFDDETDLLAVAAGVSRFLAVESCGQCHPCKFTGLAIADTLDEVLSGDASADAMDRLPGLLDQVVEGARCNLALQQPATVASLVELAASGTADRGRRTIAPRLVAPIVGIDDDGRFVLDDTQGTKQPDWSQDDTWDGRVPAEEVDVAVRTA